MNPWHIIWLPSALWLLAACCRLAITARRNRPRPSVAPSPEAEPLLCEICAAPYMVAAYVSSPNPIRLCAACVAEDAGFKVPSRSEN